jgi:hypothetical protein
MPQLRFQTLLPIYRNTAFTADGKAGVLTVADQVVLDTLRWIDLDPDALQDSGLTLKADPASLTVGATVNLDIAPPRLALGRLVTDVDALLKTPRARTEEPDAYFLSGSGYAAGQANPPPLLAAYRQVLALTALLKEAAAAFDPSRQELLFIVAGVRINVPTLYQADQLAQLDETAWNELAAVFAEDTHRDQKLEILSSASVHLVEAQPPAERFAYLLKNLGSLKAEVAKGYRLFVSSFSYAKVRSELETARLEFIGKIHKTLVDIQGQLLGIPIATFVVASQMKGADKCSPEGWMDAAVLAGAWIFYVLLLLAIANQWLTLGAINAEIDRQKKKVAKDFEAASALFKDVFDQLSTRTKVYRGAFILVGVIGLAGALFATWAFSHVAPGAVWGCLSGQIPIVFTPPKP